MLISTAVLSVDYDVMGASSNLEKHEIVLYLAVRLALTLCVLLKR